MPIVAYCRLCPGGKMADETVTCNIIEDVVEYDAAGELVVINVIEDGVT